MVLAPAAAEVAAAGVAEAPPFEPAHQALVNHLVETLAVLLGNEDPGKHGGTGEKQREREVQFSSFRPCHCWKRQLLLLHIRATSSTLEFHWKNTKEKQHFRRYTIQKS